jgi:hypothetical protein
MHGKSELFGSHLFGRDNKGNFVNLLEIFAIVFKIAKK